MMSFIIINNDPQILFFAPLREVIVSEKVLKRGIGSLKQGTLK